MGRCGGGGGVVVVWWVECAVCGVLCVVRGVCVVWCGVCCACCVVLCGVVWCVCCGVRWWWWCVVVVVVVRMINDTASLSWRLRAMHLIGWQNTWEQAPGVPATPSPALMAGATLAVYLCTRPKKPNEAPTAEPLQKTALAGPCAPVEPAIKA